MGTRTIGKRACFCTSFSRWPYAKVAIFGETRKRKLWLEDRNMVNEIKNNAIGKNNSLTFIYLREFGINTIVMTTTAWRQLAK
ncbi:hypothetical protein HMPREF6745_2673 [Prevotella sp. oral taxon 472 str. F0295]|nr:hypothetical protein HMPREF6745_2673 [Prevotella sp. oral taxon 472 str. F0295]